jgi:hypothetical protein
MARGLRILLSGMLAGDPHQGGATWAVLQYAVGLRRLGHDVYVVEPIAQRALQPEGAPLAQSANARYFREVMARFDLTSRAALLRQETRETVGLGYGKMARAVRQCDLLINISGMLTDPRLIASIPRRVYLDLDPAFNQLWHAVEGIDIGLEGHTHFVTVGALIGTPACDVPTCGRNWIPTLPPVVLPEWPAVPGRPDGAWTTVGNWRGYGSIEHDGVKYGQKAHSFRRIADLPARTRVPLRPALSIHQDEVGDLAVLAANKWEVVNPAIVAATPDAYRLFIQRSKGELGIVKSGYVLSRCGWFSDRSAGYLASGRPVVAEDTGFGSVLPIGEGLLSFRTVEEAAAALDSASAAYDRNCRRAREIADTFFSSDIVLRTLLERVGVANDADSERPSDTAGAVVGASAPARGSAR